MAALCSGQNRARRSLSFVREASHLLTRSGRERWPSISVTLTRPHTSHESVARFLFTGSAMKPRGGACRKLKKTLRALESKFSRGTNIINHQFWVSSEEQHPWRRAHTRGCEFYSKEGRPIEKKRKRAGESEEGEREKREWRS